MSAIYKIEGPLRLGRTIASHVSPFPKACSSTDMEKESVIHKQDAWMRQAWNKTMSEKLGIPDRYSHVAVLIVRWVKELDSELKCWEEVSSMHSMSKSVR